MRTKVTGRFIVGYDGADHVVYRDGELVYENDRIIFVGHDFPGSVDKEITAGDAVVSPGFLDMNALADIDHGILDMWPTPELIPATSGPKTTSATVATSCSAPTMSG